MNNSSLASILDSSDRSLFDVPSKAKGPQGSLPLTPQMLVERPSGDIFGWTMNAGMGWEPAKLGGREILLLSTHGGCALRMGHPLRLAITAAIGR